MNLRSEETPKKKSNKKIDWKKIGETKLLFDPLPDTQTMGTPTKGVEIKTHVADQP